MYAILLNTTTYTKVENIMLTEDARQIGHILHDFINLKSPEQANL